MMLDTHKEIQRLVDLGFDQVKAEAIVSLHLRSDEHLATKADLLQVKTELSGEIKALQRDNLFDRAILLLIFAIVLTPLLKTLIS
jgi:hypothetical protein